MGKVLRKTVLAGGEVHPAGTVWSKELAEVIPAEFWSGTDVPAKGDDSTSKPQAKRSTGKN